MLRQRPMFASQKQFLQGVGRRVPYPLLRPLSKPTHHARRLHARQSIHDRRYVALGSKVTPKNILIAYVALSLILTCAYEPLRERGVFGDIADATVFRVIPPKLVERADDADEATYQPITKDNEIRLLVLEPGTPGDELKCHLVNAELSWRTRYEALSYHWGDGTNPRQLSCSGRTENVYANLHYALSDLRYPDRERILWTDRLCINQSDKEEESTQIKRMGEIYSQASQVLIHLGKTDPSVEGAMEAIRRADWELASLTSRWNPAWLMYTMWCRLTKDEINWDPVIPLIRRPWFQRTWVFQEAVLAKRGQVVCGDQSIPWAVFERSMKAMTLEKLHGKDIPAYESTDDSIMSGISLMMSTRLIQHPDWTNLLPHVLLYQPVPGPRLYGQGSLKLLDLILESRSFLCKEPHDKIFGMLGVTSEDKSCEYLNVDYSLSPGDVYRKFVLWEIFHNKSLRVLGSSSEKAGSHESSPSWVADFTRLDPHSSLTGTKNRVKFNASAGLPMQIRTSNEGKVLHVKGRIVDTLHTIGKVSTTAPDTFAGENAHVLNFESLSHLRLNKDMIEEARDIWLAAKGRLIHSLGPVIKAAGKTHTLTRADGKISWSPFLRTLVCNRTHEGKVATTDFILGDVASFVRQTLEVDVVPEYFLQKDRSEAISGLQAFLRLTESRRFAATDMGLAGYVPMRAKKGDLVCILHGSDVPFVVRKGAGGKYLLVGECYMHYIMNGEALGMTAIKNEDEIFTFV